MMQLVTKLRTDNKVLEGVNERLLTRIDGYERRATQAKGADSSKDDELERTKAALSKAE